MPVYQKNSPKPRKVKESDKEYLAWLRTLPCAVCGHNPPSEAAHVRLGGRAGIGQKPLFSAVPLCHAHHAQQHTQSHLSIMSDELWLGMADLYLQRWKESVIKKESPTHR